MPDRTDSLLETHLAAAKSGDREALERVLCAAQEWLGRDVVQSMGEPLRAQTRPSDLVQDCSVEVVRCIANFEGTSVAQFRSWVSTILQNCVRKQARFLAAQRRKSPSRTSQLKVVAEEVLPTVPSPASELQQAEALLILQESLESLREDYRMILEQVPLAGRPVVDVAKDLGRSDAATRMLLSRARLALADAMKRSES